MKILYFAPIAYNRLKQRPQHIAEMLSKEHEIWYIEPTVSIMKYILKGGRSYKREEYDINPKLHVLKLNGGLSAHISFQAVDYLKLNTRSERFQLSGLIKDCDIIWVGYCGWYDVIADVKGKTIIYDKMDDDVSITQNSLLKKYIKRAEPKLVKKANIIFATAMKFYQDLLKIKDSVYYVPNAFDKDAEFPVETTPIDKENKKIFGYVGTIAHWFDYKAIETIVEADDKNYVILVGPSEIPLVLHDRVSHIGAVPKEEIWKHIHSFDICLYPFKRNEFLDTIDPVKIYEYLACNKPVIAVDSMETRKYGKLIERYTDYDNLKQLAITPLPQPFETEYELKQYFDNNSWENRVKTILSMLK